MGRQSRNRVLDKLKQRVLALDAQSVDKLYGLEPVYEPGATGSDADLSAYVEFLCPWCCENVGTSIDLTGGSRRCVEDCQVCCAPMEITIEVDGRGRLRAVTAQR
jgi:hypothetical protein